MRSSFVLVTLSAFLISGASLPRDTNQNVTEQRDDAYSVHLVENLLQYPTQLGAGFTEKQLNRLGDRVSIALLKILPEGELSNPQKVRSFLPLITGSISLSQLDFNRRDRNPKVTLFLLRHLENEDRRLKEEILHLMDFIKEKTTNH